MKKVCSICKWSGMDTECLVYDNPAISGDSLLVCPKCRDIETSIRTACMHEGCNNVANCGTPTKNGYWQSCGEHIKKEGL